MLTRRNFFAGACCLFHAGPTLAASRGRGGPKFICTASDDDPPTASSANPVGTSPESRTVVVDGREVRRYRRATQYGPERWLPQHGSTPDTGVITLNVHFMGGTAADQKRVWLTASEWLRGGLEKKIR